jgi:hypothetical protein
MGRKKNGCEEFSGIENRNEDLADLNHGLRILASLIVEKHLQRLGVAEKVRHPENGLKEDNESSLT